MCLATIGLVILAIIAVEGITVAVIWYQDIRQMKGHPDPYWAREVEREEFDP